jgi:4-hydroxybenzoyl-CoA reductase subunit beta
MKRRILNPGYVIDLKNIPGLSGIQALPNGSMKIGPLAKLAEVASSGVIRKYYPSLAKAASSVGSYQIRNLGTIGGNLCLDTKCHYFNQSSWWKKSSAQCRKAGGDRCYAFPSSIHGCFALQSGDTVVALIAHHATVRITGPEEEKIIPLEEFYTGRGIDPLNLKLGEILSEIDIPPSNGTKVVFFKYLPRNTIDFALVSVAVSFDKFPLEARIVIGGVASAPQRVKEAEELLIQKLDGDVSDEVGKLAAARVRIVSPIKSEANYRREIIRLLVRDATKCIQVSHEN